MFRNHKGSIYSKLAGSKPDRQGGDERNIPKNNTRGVETQSGKDTIPQRRSQR